MIPLDACYAPSLKVSQPIPSFLPPESNSVLHMYMLPRFAVRLTISYWMKLSPSRHPGYFQNPSYPPFHAIIFFQTVQFQRISLYPLIKHSPRDFWSTMAQLEELISISAAVQNLTVDFKSMTNIEIASNWNRETVVSHPLDGTFQS